MKRILLILFTVLSPFFACFSPLSAQLKFGYISYDSVLHQMPEYAQAKQNLQTLREKYDQEATRGEEEFQRKFSDFLQGQKEFPENILVKRQAELQSLMEAGIKFRQEARQLLRKAEQDMLVDVRARLNEVICAVGVESGYAYIINIDGDACPFISPMLGDDVTQLVLHRLGIETPQPQLEPVITEPMSETEEK
ncbi:MAG: OmpH family outer membrane protein [Bacteroidaceae bacterium]|nr:OmpH family outer membrane protein [Bacteroidaceae bacterium]